MRVRRALPARYVQRGLSAFMALALIASAGAFRPIVARAVDNPIVTENQQPGSAAWRIGWFVSDDATGQIKGYASATSVSHGQTITLYVTVNPAQLYTLDIYRIGWYGGLGGRLRLHQSGLQGFRQQACQPDSTTGLIACHWTPSFTLTIPTDWTSGAYLALLTNSMSFQNYIPFVVKDGRPAAYVYQEPVNTSEAYNNYPNDGLTGKSLYAYNSYGTYTVAGDQRAVKVSFDRPFTRDGSGLFLTFDVQLVRWLEQSGFDVTYTTDVDIHANGAALLQSKALVVAGHDEYWSKDMYDAVQAARDAGVSLAFLGADAVSWQVRYEASSDGVPNRVIVCYKDAGIDPVQGPTTTVRWRSAFLNRPEQVLAGVQSEGQVAWGNNAGYVVTNSSSWVYAGTGLKDGDVLPGIVGYEMDRLMPAYPPPSSANQTLLSWSPYINGNGSSNYSNSSIYQAPSGAWVFASGTLSWSWGLDPWDQNVGDPRIRKMTANILNAFVLGAPIVQDLKVTAPGSAATGKTFSVTVTADNARGNTVTGYSGTLHFSSSDTSTGVVLPADSRLTNGVGTFSVTLIKSGPQTLIVADAANALSTTVTLPVDAGPATHLALSLAAPTATAGVQFPFKVMAQDQYGNTDPGYKGTVHFATSDDSPGVVLPPDTALVNGQGSFAATLDQAGTQTLNASILATATTPATPAFSATATILVLAAPANHLVMAASAPAMTAGTSLGFTVTAQDQFGNTDRAYAGTLRFASSDTSPGVALPPDSTLTDGNGSFSATLDRAGSQTVSASDTVRPAVTGSFTVTVNPAPANHLAVAQTSGEPATAGTAFSFTVTAQDPYGNTDPSSSGTVHFTSSDTSGGVKLPADSALTNGLGTFSAVLIRAGSQTIVATDITQPAISGSMSIRVVAAAAATLGLAVPSSVVAGQTFYARVTLYDQFGNVATGYAGTVHFTTSDVLAASLGKMPADYTFTAADAGSHSFVVTLMTVPSQTISVIDTGNARLSATSPPIAVRLL
jgi:N,N-dimethylformamidase beta subunit-like protein